MGAAIAHAVVFVAVQASKLLKNAWRTSSQQFCSHIGNQNLRGQPDSAAASGEIFSFVAETALKRLSHQTSLRSQNSHQAFVDCDYTGNGIVDASDYVVSGKLDGEVSAGIIADGNGDFRVNSADYEIIRRNFGLTLPPAGQIESSVPEPPGGRTVSFHRFCGDLSRPHIYCAE
jgi:hypothetical protein